MQSIHCEEEEEEQEQEQDKEALAVQVYVISYYTLYILPPFLG